MTRIHALTILGSAAIGALVGFGIMFLILTRADDTYQEVDPRPFTTSECWGGNVSP